METLILRKADGPNVNVCQEGDKFHAYVSEYGYELAFATGNTREEALLHLSEKLARKLAKVQEVLHENVTHKEDGMKTYLVPGVPVPVIGCYSEAFCHCKHAGRPVSVELVAGEYPSGAVHRDGNRYTGFTTGECEIYRDEGGYYVYAREEGEKGDENPEKVQQELTEMILKAFNTEKV